MVSTPEDWKSNIHDDAQACCWLRGLVPKAWSQHGNIASEDMELTDLLAGSWPVELPRDGSGGPGARTTDPPRHQATACTSQCLEQNFRHLFEHWRQRLVRLNPARMRVTCSECSKDVGSLFSCRPHTVCCQANATI